MGDPISTSLAVVGSAVGAFGAYKSAKKQKKAAAAAAAAIDRASKTSVVTTTNTAAAATTKNVEASQRALANAARKRYSVSDTVNNFTPSGLRKTLG